METIHKDSIDATISESKIQQTQVKKPDKTPDVSYTQNREISWLAFEGRMLEEASDKNVPLCERLTFVSIFTTNLDEFFRVRVGSLYDLSTWTPQAKDNKTLMTPDEQLSAIFSAVKPLIKQRDKVYKQIMKELSAYDIEEIDIDSLKKKQRKWAREYFRSLAHPMLSAQVIDERHPFPFLRNKSLYIAALLTDKKGKQHMGMVPIPQELPQYITNPENPLHFMRIESLILHHIDELFCNYTVSDACIISVTRNADIDFDEDKFDDTEVDYRTFMSRMLKKRNRLNPVRLEVEGKLSQKLADKLLPRLNLKENQVFSGKCPLSTTWAFSLESKLPAALKAELCYNPYQPRDSKIFDYNRSMIEQIKEHDRVLFYPYDSMRPFLNVLKEAASDKDVISIKITLYRLASDSRVATYLAEAAENGKEVTVLMELRARFDEANNIEWSKRMEEAGCHIIYGPDGYKCHSKICLITRREGNQVKNIVQIGTGNYNEKTARLYADICVMTANERIGRDAVAFFQNMLIGNLNGAYETLLVAPSNMKATYLALMDKEIAKGSAGRIMLKANALTERNVIDKLKEASCAGVQVYLNLRSISCLVPGIKGKTENIHIRSVAGRFLEHARVYCFGSGESQQVYISSADLMTRNLVHRVEIGLHIMDSQVKKSILLYMEKLFADNVKARELQSDGSYILPQNDDEHHTSSNNTDKQNGVDGGQGDGAGVEADGKGGNESKICAQQYFAEHPLQDEQAYKKKARLEIGRGARQGNVDSASNEPRKDNFFQRLFSSFNKE